MGEQATKKAREMMEAKNEAVPASPSSDKENKSGLVLNTGPNLAVGEVAKTYGKKPPVLKQKVLGTSNGSLAVQKVEESKPMDTSETGGEATEVVETKVAPEHPPWGRCLANGEECPVHSNILPRAHWAFYSTMEEIDDLVEGLNPRGIREGELKDKLLLERERIDQRVKKCKVDQLVVSEEEVDKLEKCQLQGVQDRRDKTSKSTGVDSVPLGTQLQGVVELSLRDQILELEEKIWVGTLGNLKVKNRDKWTHTIGAKKYDMGVDSLVWGEGDKFEKDALLDIETVSDTPDAEAGKRDSGASTASNSEMRGMVRQKAAAILQVGQMITDREKYLKEPLGEDEKEKMKRLKKEEEEKKRKEQQGEEEEEEEEVEDMDVEVKVVMNSYKRWEKSLMSSVNFGQLFIHLTTLDNSIVWSKSIMNTKCKVCRRKADSDNMLLCDSCDNGHHLYCLKPKLKTIMDIRLSWDHSINILFSWDLLVNVRFCGDLDINIRLRWDLDINIRLSWDLNMDIRFSKGIGTGICDSWVISPSIETSNWGNSSTDGLSSISNGTNSSTKMTGSISVIPSISTIPSI